MTDEQRARDLVAQLAAHQFESAEATFDETMREKLPAEKLRAVWTSVESGAGVFQHIDAVSVADQGGHHVALVKATFAAAPLVVRVVLDARGHVSGLFVTPGDTAAAWTPPAYAKVDAFEEEPVTVGTSPALPGVLTIPRGAKTFPAVVLVHGSGPNDADETLGAIKPFRDLAWGLASRGVAVLRYDKRTRVDPTGVRTQEEEVEDAAHAAVALLGQTPGVDPTRVVLLGHSQGGFLAPRIARGDPAIKGLVILAGSTRPLEDSLLSQLHYLAKLDPERPELAAMIQAAERFKHAVEDPALKPDTMVQVPMTSPIPGAYFLDVRGYHPEKVAASLSIPMLVLQGERDYQVTVADDFAGWRAALRKKKSVTLRTYPELNHAFVAGTGPSTPGDYAKPGHVDERVITDVAAFVSHLPAASRR